jgi:hypothetical protein
MLGLFWACLGSSTLENNTPGTTHLSGVGSAPSIYIYIYIFLKGVVGGRGGVGGREEWILLPPHPRKSAPINVPDAPARSRRSYELKSGSLARCGLGAYCCMLTSMVGPNWVGARDDCVQAPPHFGSF